MSHPEYENIGTPFARLVEECGELIQAASKCDRFGATNYHPKRDGNNTERLLSEWEDVQKAFKHYLESL